MVEIITNAVEVASESGLGPIELIGLAFLTGFVGAMLYLSFNKKKKKSVTTKE